MPATVLKKSKPGINQRLYIVLRNISSLLKDAVISRNIDGKDLIEKAIKLGGDVPL